MLESLKTADDQCSGVYYFITCLFFFYSTVEISFILKEYKHINILPDKLRINSKNIRKKHFYY